MAHQNQTVEDDNENGLFSYFGKTIKNAFSGEDENQN